MGNGSSTGEGTYTPYGTRDVRETAEYSNWPELVGAKLAESSGLGRNSYNKLAAAYIKCIKIFSMSLK